MLIYPEIFYYLIAVRGKFSFWGSLSPPAGGALPLAPSRCETPPKREFSPDSSNYYKPLTNSLIYVKLG